MKVIINEWENGDFLNPRIKRGIRKIVKEVLQRENCSPEVEIGVVFTNNQKIKELNKKYRKVNQATDVLSFPLEEKKLLGDVVISLEMAKSQAKEYKHSFEKELSILIIHGILHLLGYDHLKKQETEEMEKKEGTIFRELEKGGDKFFG